MRCATSSLLVLALAGFLGLVHVEVSRFRIGRHDFPLLPSSHLHTTRLSVCLVRGTEARPTAAAAAAVAAAWLALARAATAAAADPALHPRHPQQHRPPAPLVDTPLFLFLHQPNDAAPHKFLPYFTYNLEGYAFFLHNQLLVPFCQVCCFYPSVLSQPPSSHTIRFTSISSRRHPRPLRVPPSGSIAFPTA